MAVSARHSSGPRPIRGPGAWRVLTSATIAWNSLEVNDEVEVGSETCATCASRMRKCAGSAARILPRILNPAQVQPRQGLIAEGVSRQSTTC